LAADASVVAAEAALEAARLEIELLVVRAPLDATVLKVDVRPGEFVAAGPSTGSPAMTLGALEPLHVRVDLDENDAALYRAGAPGKGFVRGRGGAEAPIPLEFARVEPYVTPKKALTGSVQERVDVRVLQIVYRVAATPAGLALYPGQQLDVFLDDAAP
ncbi:MAG TPA: HlyD family secretion protein, partial [Planctomycetota bacterium]|nr:HlyD family secretion protein [Planctomycetota bacterium]